MSHFVITSKKHSPTFQVWVGNCTQQHAETVLEQLQNEPVAPDDLELTQTQRLYDMAPPKKRRTLRRRSR